MLRPFIVKVSVLGYFPYLNIVIKERYIARENFLSSYMRIGHNYQLNKKIKYNK